MMFVNILKRIQHQIVLPIQLSMESIVNVFLTSSQLNQEFVMLALPENIGMVLNAQNKNSLVLLDIFGILSIMHVFQKLLYVMLLNFGMELSVDVDKDFSGSMENVNNVILEHFLMV